MDLRRAWYYGWAVVVKSFPGHKGRPGQQGGSLPRAGGIGAIKWSGNRASAKTRAKGMEVTGTVDEKVTWKGHGKARKRIKRYVGQVILGIGAPGGLVKSTHADKGKVKKWVEYAMNEYVEGNQQPLRLESWDRG